MEHPPSRLRVVASGAFGATTHDLVSCGALPFEPEAAIGHEEARVDRFVTLRLQCGFDLLEIHVWLPPEQSARGRLTDARCEQEQARGKVSAFHPAP